nr:reverse transcriptase domain-containing protein [Tanacetum cinerariifolium]
MSTHSSARNLFPPLDNPDLTIRRRSCADPTLLNEFEMAIEGNGDPPVPDLRTMKELCQPSLNGWGGPIALIAIQAMNFGLKNDMILTSSKFLPFSWTSGNSINTFEQMAKMFLGKYFPPSMVTKLRNEITNFHQRPNESLFKAWERYKLSIDHFPNHNMLPVTQIDTFYNGLTLRHRYTINAAAGGTFMKRPLKAEMAKINKNLMRVLQVNQQVKAVTASCETCGGPHSYNDCLATVGQTQNVYIAGAYQGGNSYQPQDLVHQPLIPQPQVVTTTEFTNYMRANDVILKNMQTITTSLTNSNLELKNMFGQFIKMNTTSSLGSGTLPSNTITNPKEDLKVERETEATKETVPPTNNESTKDVQPPVVQVETLIPNSKPIIDPVVEPVVAPVSALKPNQKPSIPYPSRLHDQKLRDKANAQKEKFFQIFQDLNFNISFTDALILMPNASINLMPLLMWNKLSLPQLTPTLMTLELADRSISRPIGVAEDVFVKVGKFHFSANFVVVDFDADPRVPLILRRSFLKTEKALIIVYEGELTLRVGKESITFNLDQTLRYSVNYNDMTANRIDVTDMACEEYSQEVLVIFFSKKSMLSLLLKMIQLHQKSITPISIQSGTFFFLKHFLIMIHHYPPLNQGKYLPQVRKELKICKAKNEKSSIDEPFEVELKDLPTHLEYAFLEGDDKLPDIISKDLSVVEKAALIKVLKSHKQAIA